MFNSSNELLAGLSSNAAMRFARSNFSTNELRPYFDEASGKAYVTRTVTNKTTGKSELAKVELATNALLRIDQWRMIDTQVSTVVRQNLRVASALRAAGLSRSVPNAFAKQYILSENRGDMTPAKLGMDPVAKSNNDRVEYNNQIVPLPVIWKDFSFTARELAASQSDGGEGLDVSGITEATRKCVELAESLVLGQIGYSFGGGNVYGLTNYPGRETATLTNPTLTTWTADVLIAEIIAMREVLRQKGFSGPFGAVYSGAWAEYFDRDYSTLKGDNTVGERVRQISEITTWVQSDTLAGFQIVLLSMQQSVFRIIDGMDFRAVQWDTAGGMEQHFKIMGIVVPEARGDFYGTTGIVHGATA
jgi:hypothetical protein